MGSPPRPDFETLLARLSRVLERRQLPFMTYEAEAISRALLVELGGAMVPFATAEDLIIHKLFAGRPRDIEDAEGVVRRKGGELDWDYLRRWVADFALVPGRENLPDALEGLRSELGDP